MTAVSPPVVPAKPEGASIALLRDCAAILIPDGRRLVLPQDTEVRIHQVLGGHFTVATGGRLYRIFEQDGDALGHAVPEEAVPLTDQGPVDQAVLHDQVWAALSACYDPEIPVNIVDLGLIYDCVIDHTGGDPAALDFEVVVQMTLTAPGCGMGPVLVEEIKQRIRRLPGIHRIDVQLIWDPPWDQSRMTEAAKLQLGLI